MHDTLLPKPGGDLVILASPMRLVGLVIHGREVRHVLRVAHGARPLPSTILRMAAATIASHRPRRVVVSPVGAVPVAEVLDPLLGALDLCTHQAGIALAQIPDIDLLAAAARSIPPPPALPLPRRRRLRMLLANLFRL